MPLQLLFLTIIGAIVGSSSFIVVRNRAQESAGGLRSTSSGGTRGDALDH